MAYMNPQQYLNAITGIGRGSRYTAFADPNEVDPNEILKVTGPYQARRGAPNYGLVIGSRGPTYDPVPTQQTQGVGAPSRFQQGPQDAGETVRNFGQQQQGFVADRPQVPPMSEQPSGGMTLPTGTAAWSGGGGMPHFMANINPGLRQLSEATVADAMNQVGDNEAQQTQVTDDPQGMMSKIGGFFTRTPGMGQTLSALGAGIAAESSQPGGSFWTGLARGSDAAMQAEQRRQVIEQQQQAAERTRAQEEEDRAAQKEVNDKIRELREGWDDTTTAEQMAADTREAGMIAFSNNNSPLGRGLIELARDFIEDPEAGPSTNFTNYDQTVYRAPDGTRTRGRKRTVGTEQTFEYFDKSLFEENVGEGMSASEAQRNSWRAGGYIADPEEEEATADAAQQLGQQERMNSRLGGAAKDANWSLVIDTETGAPIYLDYQMAGAVPIAWDDDGNPTDWREGELDDLRLWQSFFGEVISNAGSETVGAGKKLFNMIVRTQLPSGILEGYTEALNYINPTVRFLSGAQMTNQEAMRYYNALLPMSGDSIENIERKRRKRDVLTNAMGGSGITEAQKLEARELLGIGPDEEMGHLFSDFGELDPSGTMAMDYYLARLTEKLGSSNTFTREQMRQMGALRGGAGGPLGSDLNIGDTPP